MVVKNRNKFEKIGMALILEFGIGTIRSLEFQNKLVSNSDSTILDFFFQNT